MPWQTQMKTLILMQSVTFIQIIATWAEKLKACQPKMLLKTSINVLYKNEEIKSQRVGSWISHSILNIVQQHIFILPGLVFQI